MSLTTWHRKAILAGTWKWCGKQALLIGEVDVPSRRGDLAKSAIDRFTFIWNVPFYCPKCLGLLPIETGSAPLPDDQLGVTMRVWSIVRLLLSRLFGVCSPF